MPKKNFKELEGTIVGRFKLLEFVGMSKSNHPLFKTECVKCGYIDNKGTDLYSLKRFGMDSNCHHLFWYSSALSDIYNHMIQKCYNETSEAYKYTGAKGIRVCDEWLTGWKFNIWAIENGYRDGLTLVRIDETKDFTPENCIWEDSSIVSKWNNGSVAISVNGIANTINGWTYKLRETNSSFNIYTYLKVNGYHETALKIAQSMNQDKTKEIVAVVVDDDLFNNNDINDIRSKMRE